MEKIEKSKVGKSKTLSTDQTTSQMMLNKPKSLFDHIAHIRETKSVDYMSTLSTGDKKTFVKYVILIGLSMDQDAIINLAYVTKYFDILPDDAFYKLCCDFVPRSRRFVKWIKSNKTKLNKDLIAIIANHFNISRREANDYCQILTNTEDGIQQIVNICQKHGKTEKEIESLLES
jgi:hypothetical protein